MPYLIAAIVGGTLGLLLIRSGRITSARLIAGFYALVGGLLGIFVLRAVVGAMGPFGAIIGATIGALLLLFAAQRFGGD